MKINLLFDLELPSACDMVIVFVGSKETTKRRNLVWPKRALEAKDILGLDFTRGLPASFDALRGQVVFSHLFMADNPKSLILLGIGDQKSFKEDNFRKLGGKIVEMARKHRAKNIALLCDDFSNKEQKNYWAALAEGAYLGCYSYDKYKSTKEEKPAASITIVGPVPSKEKEEELLRAKITAHGICYARDLINECAGQLTPQRLAELAQKAGKEFGFFVEVLDPKKLSENNLNLILAVGQGSEKKDSPRLVQMAYRPKDGYKKHICLVGKGITFDTGGLDLKPPSGMITMKSDMSGAAAVLGTMISIAQIKPRVALSAYLSCAENSIGPNAYHPSDVIFSKMGISVEIDNTDAEGRLVLADALTYAQEKDSEADLFIDIATLTGACKIALGPNTAGVFSNDDSIPDKLRRLGEKCGESFWHMPLNDALDDQLKSDIADIKNCGQRWGGAITAALFLKRFILKNNKWCHIDIAGAAFSDKKMGYKPKGGVGFGVKTLTEFIAAQED